MRWDKGGLFSHQPAGHSCRDPHHHHPPRAGGQQDQQDLRPGAVQQAAQPPDSGHEQEQDRGHRAGSFRGSLQHY